MAIIYTYPIKTNPVGSDLILISDSANSNKTKQVKVSSLPSAGGGSVSSVGLSLSGIAAFAITGDNPITSSGTIVLGTTGGSAGQFLDYQGNWSTPATSSSLAILNEGSDIAGAATSINFVGSGVTATAATNAVTVTIPDAFVIEDVQYSVAVAKGDALYISGPAHGSGRPTVGIADATAQQAGNKKYPVVGLALADYSPGEGKMIVTGILNDFNTNSITNPLIGQPVYISNSGSTGDTLTGTKPTGTDVIQNVAIINKTGANGSLQVSCIGRINDLPNLEQGKIWLGDANGVPSALTIGNNTAVLTSNGTTASWSPIPDINLASGVTGTLGVDNGGTGANYDPTAGGVIFGNANEDGYAQASGLSYVAGEYSLKVVSTGNAYPSGLFENPNVTSAIAGGGNGTYTSSIGALNVFNNSAGQTNGGTAIAVAGSDNIANSKGRLMSFYMASHLGPGLERVGDITADRGTGTVAFANVSDYRLKENVVSLPSSTNKIKALNPVSYNMIGFDKVVEGFLAHELQEEFPDAVTGEKDAVDSDGNINPQMVDYTKIIPTLVGAIKELTARIEALEA